MDLAPETLADATDVDALIERVFGPGRYAKISERLREGRAPRLDFSVVAREEGVPVGCVRLWPIRVGDTAALLLGPIAVDPATRSRGVGASMVRSACRAVDAAGSLPILLVGDAAFFAPHGFTAASRGVIMPRPVDRRRVLVRAATGVVLAGVARPG